MQVGKLSWGEEGRGSHRFGDDTVWERLRVGGRPRGLKHDKDKKQREEK